MTLFEANGAILLEKWRVGSDSVIDFLQECTPRLFLITSRRRDVLTVWQPVSCGRRGLLLLAAQRRRVIVIVSTTGKSMTFWHGGGHGRHSLQGLLSPAAGC